MVPLQFDIVPLQFDIVPLQFDIVPLQFDIVPLQFDIVPLQFIYKYVYFLIYRGINKTMYCTNRNTCEISVLKAVSL
jgi:hypothetical protein